MNLKEFSKWKILLLELLNTLVDIDDGAAKNGIELKHRLSLGQHLTKVFYRRLLALQLGELLRKSPEGIDSQRRSLLAPSHRAERKPSRAQC